MSSEEDRTKINWDYRFRSFKGWVPVIVLVYIGFTQYAFCYEFLYNELNKTLGRRSVFIGLCIVHGWLSFTLLSSWFFIFYFGPGKPPGKVKLFDLEKYVRTGNILTEKLNDNSMVCTTDASLNDTITRIGSSLTIGEDEKAGRGDNNNNNDININDTSSEKENEGFSFIDPPEIFFCDSEGLPFWCSTCKSIKSLRSHHSSWYNTCVPKFDHFCVWIGDLIGYRNNQYYIIFVFSFWLLFLFDVISMICFSSKLHNFGKTHTLHPVLIIMYIVDCFWFTMITSLVYTTVKHLINNETTMDMLQINKRRKYLRDDAIKKTGTWRVMMQILRGYNIDDDSVVTPYERYINIQHPVLSNIRLIIRLKQGEKPYKKDIWSNIKDTFLIRDKYKSLDNSSSILQFDNESFSDNFKSLINDKIQKNDFRIMSNVVPTNLN